MRYRLKICFFTLCCCVCFWGCEDELKLDIDQRKPKLVVNSMFSPNNDMMVHVSHSLGITTKGNLKSISNANVVITDGAGKETKLPHFDKGFYLLEDFKVEEGKKYYINVDCEGLPPVNASNRVPSQFNASFQDSTRGYYMQVKVLEVKVTIQDSPNEKNYYLVEAYREVMVDIDGTKYAQKYQASILSSDKLAENDFFDTDNMFQRIYLPDSDFSGETYTLKASVELFMENQGGKLCLEVKSVSKELYDYLKTLELARIYGDDPSFSSPVQVYNNINSGFGIFGAYTSQFIILNMQGK